MTQPTTNSDGELDDPGRDPVGLAVPRNPLGGADQDTGQGTPEGTPGIEGQSMMPEAPGEDDERA
jgi:hypothetical protein